MAGVTTALVAYILLAQAFPSLLKNRAQYYLAFAAILLIIFLDAVTVVAPRGAFIAFIYFVTAVLQMAAMVFLLLAAGGMSAGELSGDIGQVIEVIRRGGTKKEVIVPLGDAARRNSESTAARPGPVDDSPRVYTIDDPGVGPPPPAQVPPVVKSESHGPLPLD
jgi:hypothetical protein